MSKIVLPVAALVFCTWAVSLAGVASLQAACEPGWDLGAINGFTSGLPCYRLFRYHWFIVCTEIFLILALAGAVVTGFFERSRMAWVGLFAVVTLLYIEMANTYLTAEDVFKTSAFDATARSRTMTAGSIMTATTNCFLIIAMGLVEQAAAPVAAKSADNV